MGMDQSFNIFRKRVIQKWPHLSGYFKDLKDLCIEILSIDEKRATLEVLTKVIQEASQSVRMQERVFVLDVRMRNNALATFLGVVDSWHDLNTMITNKLLEDGIYLDEHYEPKIKIMESGYDDPNTNCFRDIEQDISLRNWHFNSVWCSKIALFEVLTPQTGRPKYNILYDGKQKPENVGGSNSKTSVKHKIEHNDHYKNSKRAREVSHYQSKPNEHKQRRNRSSLSEHVQNNKQHSFKLRGQRQYDNKYNDYGSYEQPLYYQRSESTDSWHDESNFSVGSKSWEYTVSKTLSTILRHNAFGFKIDEEYKQYGKKGLEKFLKHFKTEGYIPVDKILKFRKFDSMQVQEQDIIGIVNNNDKKRFHLEKCADGSLKIRANQGHSVKAEKLDLEEIDDTKQFPCIVHGTNWGAWKMIQKSGLKNMKRNHIHFTTAEPSDARKVISGMRYSSTVFVYLDPDKCIQNGIKFYKSQNEVILSPGNEKGCIPVQCFKEVFGLDKQKGRVQLYPFPQHSSDNKYKKVEKEIKPDETSSTVAK